MRLSHLWIENFKACREVRLDLAPVTVLIGANNAGKSSVLHSIALLAQSMQGAGFTSHGDLVDLGREVHTLIHLGVDGSRTDAAEIGLRWDEPADGGQPTIDLTSRITGGGFNTRLTISRPADDAEPVSLQVDWPAIEAALKTGGGQRPLGLSLSASRSTGMLC